MMAVTWELDAVAGREAVDEVCTEKLSRRGRELNAIDGIVRAGVAPPTEVFILLQRGVDSLHESSESSIPICLNTTGGGAASAVAAAGGVRV